MPPEAWPSHLRLLLGARPWLCWPCVPLLLPAVSHPVPTQPAATSGFLTGALRHWGRDTFLSQGTVSHIPRCSVCGLWSLKAGNVLPPFSAITRICPLPPRDQTPPRAAEPFQACHAPCEGDHDACHTGRGREGPHWAWSGGKNVSSKLSRPKGSLSLMGLRFGHRPAPSQRSPNLQPDPAVFATGFVGAEPYASRRVFRGCVCYNGRAEKPPTPHGRGADSISYPALSRKSLLPPVTHDGFGKLCEWPEFFFTFPG